MPGFHGRPAPCVSVACSWSSCSCSCLGSGLRSESSTRFDPAGDDLHVGQEQVFVEGAEIGQRIGAAEGGHHQHQAAGLADQGQPGGVALVACGSGPACRPVPATPGSLFSAGRSSHSPSTRGSGMAAMAHLRRCATGPGRASRPSATRRACSCPTLDSRPNRFSWPDPRACLRRWGASRGVYPRGCRHLSAGINPAARFLRRRRAPIPPAHVLPLPGGGCLGAGRRSGRGRRRRRCGPGRPPGPAGRCAVTIRSAARRASSRGV